MNMLTPNQQGFIPMMLAILGVIALIIFLVYSRVASVNTT
jgi:flagellar biogenesis protein FliO